MVPYYSLCLLKAPNKHRYRVFAEKHPESDFFPKWLINEMKQIYTNIRSAAWSLENIQARLTSEGIKSVIYFECLQADF
ncbi:MAG: hypothetical protein ACFFDN_03110 [Candidatus Hodarchaeota archaeon]